MDSSKINQQTSGKKRKNNDTISDTAADELKHDTSKKSEKKRANDTGESKPRIVLTFRTEKQGKKASNMKIVHAEEKHEVASQKHSRNLDTQDEEFNESLVSPQKNKNSGSDNSLNTSTKRPIRSKVQTSNLLAKAMARKERCYNIFLPWEGPSPRPSRRTIKPSAKVLAKLEQDTNVKIVSEEKSAEATIQKIRSARQRSTEHVDDKIISPEVTGKLSVKKRGRRSSVENVRKDTEENDNKRKHLGTLGLKEVEDGNDDLYIHTLDDSNDEEQKKQSSVADETEEVEEMIEEEEKDDGSDVIEVQREKEDDGSDVIEEQSEEEDDELDVIEEQSEEEGDGLDVIEEQSEESTDEGSGDNYVEPIKKTKRPLKKNKDYTAVKKGRNSAADETEEVEEMIEEEEEDDGSDVIEEQSEESTDEGSGDEYVEPIKKTRRSLKKTKNYPAVKKRRSRMKDKEYVAKVDNELNQTGSRRHPRRYRRPINYNDLDENIYMQSEPAGGDEGSEASSSDEERTVMGSCYCEDSSNLYVEPSELTVVDGGQERKDSGVIEPVFCRAVSSVGALRVGCSLAAARAGLLLRAGPRAPFALLCGQHTAQLRKHLCCPTCGLFCAQGTFYQCSMKHFFHLTCGVQGLYEKPKMPPGCPHCGLYYRARLRWPACNRDCFEVKVEMKCSNKTVYLPEQREQSTQAYISFSARNAENLDKEPIIPEELLPCTPIDLKDLCTRKDNTDYEELLSTSSSERLLEAIANKEKADELLPKIISGIDLNAVLESESGGSYLHFASKRGVLAAVYLLHAAGAALDHADAEGRTPLLAAVHALTDESSDKASDKTKRNCEDNIVDLESFEDDEPNIAEEIIDEDESKKEETDENIDVLSEGQKIKKNEDLLGVIRYLVAAGCDVLFAGPGGQTALHVAAMHGKEEAVRALLAAPKPDTGVRVRDAGGWTPLVWAAENGHHEVVRALLAAGARAESADAGGNSALHWAAAAGRALALRLLLHAAPRARDAPNEHGDTPLHIAARQGHYSCVVLLLAQGALTDVENSDGELASEVCSGECQAAITLNMQIALATKDGPTKIQRFVSSDISKGKELYPIPCVNDVDDTPAPDDFVYVTENVMSKHICIDNTIDTSQGCTCKEIDCSSSECECSLLGVRKWFANGRLLPDFPYHDPPMLFECNYTCSCSPKACSNRVVSRLSRAGAVFAAAQVYRVGGGRGWGLRLGAAAGPLPRGSPVARYCGELLPPDAADARADDQYMFSLDLKPDLLAGQPLCVDAARFGSAARFVNHSCAPSLAAVRVLRRERDLRAPAVVLVALKPLRAGDALTFDYGDKFWSVKSDWMKCECGSPNCRYPATTSDNDMNQ